MSRTHLVGQQLTSAAGVRPCVVVYYSAWLAPFQVGFAAVAADTARYP